MTNPAIPETSIPLIRKSLAVFTYGLIGASPALFVLPTFVVFMNAVANKSDLNEPACVLVAGLASLSILLGLGPAVYAMSGAFSLGRGTWNPARAYLRCGIALGLTGLLSTALLVFMGLIAFLHNTDWWS